MAGAAPVVEGARGPLRAAVSQRSPAVGTALDEGEARARARVWAARAVPDAAIDAVRVGSVLYRPDGGCTLRYVVGLAPPGREQILLVEVPRAGTDITVRPFPDDPGLPTLRRALDPVLMREVLGRVVPGTGGDRGVGRCRVDVVHYPRQGRCVLRYRLAPGAGGPGELRHPVVFGKVYGDATAQASASALRVLRGGLQRLRDRLLVEVPRPLAVVPPLRLGLAEAIPGRPMLPSLLQASCDPSDPPRGTERAALEDAVGTAARTAAAVHRCPPSGPPLPVRDLAAERAATEGDLTLLDPVWPDVAAHLRRGVARVLDATVDHRRPTPSGGWPVAPVLGHGDFTPGQLLLDGSGGVGLVDVDTLCIAEPALDLGRFLAYLHVTGMRRSRAAGPLLADLTAVFLESYLEAGPASGGAPAPAGDARRLLLARTAAYRALALGRVGASACWQLKDDRLRAVVDALDAGDQWMRSGAG
jgi:hypothetical protein